MGGKFVGEAGMGMDLQQQLREIHAGQQGFNLLRQKGQAGQFIQFVKVSNRQCWPFTGQIQLNGFIVIEVGGHLFVGSIQLAYQAIDGLSRIQWMGPRDLQT